MLREILQHLTFFYVRKNFPPLSMSARSPFASVGNLNNYHQIILFQSSNTQ